MAHLVQQAQAPGRPIRQHSHRDRTARAVQQRSSTTFLDDDARAGEVALTYPVSRSHSLQFNEAAGYYRRNQPPEDLNLLVDSVALQ